MMNRFKSEKASITLYVTVACMFIMIVGISTYVLSNNKQQAQLAQLKQIEKQYQTGLTQEELHNEYIGGDIINIYTEEQFLKIGSGEEVYINGKIYTMTTNKTYVLQENWEDNTQYPAIVANIENGNGVLIKDY